MPETIPTVRVVSGDSYANINESDYDPAIHTLVDPSHVFATGQDEPGEGNDTSDASSGATNNLGDLRKQYREKFGKGPSPKWTADQIAEKLAA